MMDALLEWGLSYAGRKSTPRDRVFHLGYKRPGGENGKPNGSLDILASLKGKFVVTFLGTFATYHNPSILLDAAENLKDSESDVFFILAGDGKLSDELRARAKLLPNVALPGWLNQDEIATLMHHSHIGVCSSTENAQFFPNKVFTYMSAGLPVLSAFQGELREMIETRKVGLYYPPTDVHEFIDCIRKFKGDAGLYERSSRNALRTFNEMFDADLIYDRYAEHIERIVYESHR
jgi:glycosyltransferase involved in cell wall biosynthesis